MDKNDILEKAKKENRACDEMYYYFYSQGARAAMAIGLVICCIAMVLDLIINSKFTLLGYFACLIQFGMQFTLHFVLAIKSKQKANIATAILHGIGLVMWIVVIVIKTIVL